MHGLLVQRLKVKGNQMGFLNFLLSFLGLNATFESTFIVWMNEMDKSDDDNCKKLETAVDIILNNNWSPLKNASAIPCKKAYRIIGHNHKEVVLGFEIKAEMFTKKEYEQCIDMFHTHKVNFTPSTRLVVNKTF